jgi:hypothetical protein
MDSEKRPVRFPISQRNYTAHSQFLSFVAPSSDQLMHQLPASPSPGLSGNVMSHLHPTDPERN